MDLCSLDGDYRYHPLAALVEIPPVTDDPFYLMGYDPEQRRARISKIMHEIVHGASLRTTRLGFWTARTASAILADHDDVPEGALDVPPSAASILGAFAPLLEGLALYGQLDYAAESASETLPFPLVHIATNNVEPSCSASRTMHAAQISYLHEDNFLQNLYLKSSIASSHYFAGYLYIKAVAARFAREAPELAGADTLLPVLNRLICDHPLLERPDLQNMQASDIIALIHESLLSLDKSRLARLAALLRRATVRDRFDNFDIHTQLATSDDHAIVFHTMENPLHRNLPNERWYLAFRGAASLHLTGWTSGRFVTMTSRGFALETENGQQQILMSWFARFPRLRAAFAKEFKSLKGTDAIVTVGNYLTLTRGQIGVAVWVDDKSKFYVPLSALEGDVISVEKDVIDAGCALSPRARRRFARNLRSNDALKAGIGDATDALLATLISNPVRRAIVRRDRFTPFLSKKGLAEWEESTRRAVLFGQTHVPKLPRDLFDAPGFPGLTTADLMPRPWVLERCT